MALIVQKYGGTSLGSVERIQAVAQRVQDTVRADNSVVVVVSAMGGTTDNLVKLAADISANPCLREVDMLLSTGEQVSIALVSMALQEIGQPAISMTGAQVGIITEAQHARARILNIETKRLEKYLKQGKVVVVAGFQGITNAVDLEITTLGRGGSDTSAVALAAALSADLCEIYTDVQGILTTDPRLVPEAQLMDEITCDEMLELASLGAKVLHPRAVEIARNYSVTLAVRSSWTEQLGTRVKAPTYSRKPLINLELACPVDSIEFDTNQARFAFLRIPDQPGIAALIFGELAGQEIDVDLIIQSIYVGSTNDIVFTVLKPIVKKVEAVAAAITPMLCNYSSMDHNQEAELIVQQNIAKVSITGAGMIGNPGVAAKMFTALADAGVNIQMISTSEVKVSCVINYADCDRAVCVLRETFKVSDTNIQSNISITPKIPGVPSVVGVALDMKQARLAVRHIPDRPGMAAKIFSLLADSNISVDMIIQSQRCHVIDGVPTRDIAFTVARIETKVAQHLLQQNAVTYGWGEVILDNSIAKVSIVGAGMCGQSGVASKMFESLAKHNINIQMITTSEIKISCVVDESEGIQALKAVHMAFGLASSRHVHPLEIKF